MRPSEANSFEMLKKSLSHGCSGIFAMKGFAENVPPSDHKRIVILLFKIGEVIGNCILELKAGFYFWQYLEVSTSPFTLAETKG
jgi:hypothetical protein